MIYNIKNSFGIYILTVLLCLFCLKITTCSPGKTQAVHSNKEIIMAHSTTYPITFANPMRNCVIPVITGATGTITWSGELELTTIYTDPGILLWEDNIVFTTAEEIVLYSHDGKKLWNRPKGTDSPVVIANDLINYANEMLYLEAVNRANGLALEDCYIPDLYGDDYYLTLLWPKENDFVTVTYMPEPMDDTEDPNAKAPKPMAIVGKTIYMSKTSEWGLEIEGTMRLPPIYIPQSDLCMLMMYEVITLDLKSEQEIARFILPLENKVNWSADNDGLLCISGYNKINKVLVVISYEGDEKWRWEDKVPNDRWVVSQPPIRPSANSVYALTDQRVLSFDNGNLAWQFPITDAVIKGGNALADGSLLVTAGKKLIHLSNVGKELFSVFLDEEIATPPVVDADGNIFVATKTKLVKIQ